VKPEAEVARSNQAMDVGRRAQPAGTVSGDAEERDWIARAQAGNEEAFRMLVDLHRDRAYRLALGIVRRPADAEEVAQDAFVRAWNGLGRYRGEARFSTWLHRIVVRRALDRASVLKGRAARETEVDEASSIAAPATGPDAEARANAARLERLLVKLSPSQRAAVTLFYYEDRSVEDVASLLGIPENTVKTHLSRARATLRQAWLEEQAS
jgi:RNA polymerase sigma-70 factor, ECF subfamily